MDHLGDVLVRLVASIIVRNEADRYLAECLAALTGFCDDIVAVDDASDDGSTEILAAFGVLTQRNERPMFFEHEGRARNSLLQFTLAQRPTHVLAIDCDEFVANGQQLRQSIETSRNVHVWTLNMQEIWGGSPAALLVRQDGGWREHAVPIVYAVPPRRNAHVWQIADRALACGREPMAVARLRNRARPSGTEILHFGWANEADRQARYDRYVEHDGGRFHRNTHIESIMWGDDKVETSSQPWPESLADQMNAIGARMLRGAAPPPPPPNPYELDLAVWNMETEEGGRWVGITWDGEVVHGVAPEGTRRP